MKTRVSHPTAALMHYAGSAMHEIMDMIQPYSLHLNNGILEACLNIRPQHVISLLRLHITCVLQGGMLHHPVVVLCC